MATIQLQYVGRVNAKPAVELKVGDVTVWNAGELETIVEIIKETSKGRLIRIQSHSSGKYYERRLINTRLIGIKA